MMWVERYRPKSIKDMVGNEETRIDFLKWLKEWKRGSKPALLIGAPGTGKTTLTHLVADELGYDLIELNASDIRTKGKMMQKLGPALSSHNLFDGKSLIFLDEIDGMYYRQDRGGIEFVQQLMKIGEVPLVMAANVEDDKKVLKLIQKSKIFRFRRVAPRLIELYIEKILKRERIKLSKESIRLIVRESKGDMRAAINTTQSLTGLTTEELSSVLSSRNLLYGLKEGFDTFFNADSQDEAYKTLRVIKTPPRDKVRIIFSSVLNSNLCSEDLIKALEKIGEADEIVKMISTTQEWRLLRYLDRILASLVKILPKGEVNFSEDDTSWDLKLRIWNDSKVLRDIAGRLSKIFHTSSREILSIFLPYLLVILMQKMDRFVTILGLDDRALKVMTKESKRIAQKVR